jgi:hypothetical protein
MFGLDHEENRVAERLQHGDEWFEMWVHEPLQQILWTVGTPQRSGPKRPNAKRNDTLANLF